MNERTFAVVANILSAMPSSQPWDDRTSAVYAIAMQKWDDGLTEKAVMKCLMTKKWRPTPAEIREVALQIKRVTVPGPTAHEQIRHIVIRYSPEERSAVADRLVKQGKISPSVPYLVSQLGGWRSVGSMTEDGLAKEIASKMDGMTEDPALDEVLETPLPAIESGKLKMIGE